MNIRNATSCATLNATLGAIFCITWDATKDATSNGMRIIIRDESNILIQDSLIKILNEVGEIIKL